MRRPLLCRMSLVYTGGMAIDVFTDNSEAALLARAFDARSGNLPKEAALVLLKARFPESDMARMIRLGELAQSGALSPNERREAESYDRVGLLLELLQSKARLSLARHS